MVGPRMPDDVVPGERSEELARARDRGVAASALAALVARMVIAGGSLVSIAVAARVLTHAELGVVSVLAGLLVYFGLGDFGLGTMLMTRLPVAAARDDTTEMRQLVGAVLSVMVLVASTLAFAVALSLLLLPWQELLGAQSLDSSEFHLALVAFVVSGALGMIGTVGTRVLAAMQRGAFARLSSCVASMVSVVAVVVCAWLDAPLWAWVTAFAIPVSLLGPAQLLHALRLFPALRPGRAEIGWGQARGIVRASSQFAVLSSGWVLTYALDAVVVAALLGAEVAAVFGVAARLFGLVTSTLYLAGQQMWPAIAEAAARGDFDWVRRRFRQSLLAVGAASSAASVVLVAVGPWLSRIWVGSELVPPRTLFVAMALWTIYLTMITQYSYLLLALEQIRTLAWVGVLIALANLPLSILFTAMIGVEGPTLGNLAAAALVQFVPTVVLTRRAWRQVAGADSFPGATA